MDLEEGAALWQLGGLPKTEEVRATRLLWHEPDIRLCTKEVARTGMRVEAQFHSRFRKRRRV